MGSIYVYSIKDPYNTSRIPGRSEKINILMYKAHFSNSCRFHTENLQKIQESVYQISYKFVFLPH